MGKPLAHFSPECIEGLKQKVLLWVTFPVRSRSDCAILSKKIQDSGAGYVSESTLYRMFLSDNGEHAFYSNTFDILSKFVGHSDMNDFERSFFQQKKAELVQGIVRIDGKQVDSLIKICIHMRAHKPLHAFAEQLDLINTVQKMTLGYEIYRALASNPNNNLDFFKHFARLPVIRESFFENCIDPEFKLSGYEEGIKYYLSSVNPDKDLSSLQEFMFGHCMLFRHYFLSGHKKSAQYYGKQLYDSIKPGGKALSGMYIYPRMRFLCYKVWWYELNNNVRAKEKHIHFLLEYAGHNMQYWNETEQRIAFSCMAEVFIACVNDNKLHHLLKTVFKVLLDSFSAQFIQYKLDKILPYTTQDGLLAYKRIF